MRQKFHPVKQETFRLLSFFKIDKFIQPLKNFIRIFKIFFNLTSPQDKNSG